MTPHFLSVPLVYKNTLEIMTVKASREDEGESDNLDKIHHKSGTFDCSSSLVRVMA